MASIVDLCWTSAEDLMRDIDLDTLYAQQLKTIGGENNPDYPYLLLIYTGKITIGISLGNYFDPHGGAGLGQSERAELLEGASWSGNSFKEPWE
jgi:hypothetical protein